MASETVTFAKNYDHVWPNRAQTAYKAGFSGRVKGEVAEGARAKGALLEGDAFPTVRADLEKRAVAEGVELLAIAGTGSRGNVTNDDISAAILANRASTPGE